MTPLISIIVPIYKAEPFLRKCVDSILAQTYSNIEVILVDDGSPDRCPAICDEYAANDRRIVVIHQQNAGVSVARNAGLDAAKGEYIAFVDDDDWIESDMYEVLYEVVKMSGADIAASSYCIGDSRPVKVCADGHVVFTPREAMKTVLQNRWELLYVWGKLFARKLVDNLRFSSSYTPTEDGPFAIRSIARCHKFAWLEYRAYHHYIHSDSLSHKPSDSIGSTLRAVDSIIDVIKSHDRDLSMAADRCTIEYGVHKAMEEAERGGLTGRVYREIVAQANAHRSDGVWEQLPLKSKLRFRLLLFGRVPFLFVRKLVRGVKRLSVV